MTIKRFIYIPLFLILTSLAWTWEPGRAGIALADGKAVDAETFRAFRQFYEYDKKLPLEAQITEDAQVPGSELMPAHRRIKLSFMSTHDERVPAILWIPIEAKGPFPCSFYLHGLGRSKADGQSIAIDLLKQNCATMALDAAYHGERAADKQPMYGTNFYRLRDGYMQTVVDYRRALDYLETRPEIDSGRTTLVGVSMGAIMGAVLAGVETRIKCPVLMVGGADRGLMSRLSQISVWKQIRAEDPKLDFDELSRIMAPSDPLNFVDKISPRPLLMINGTKDDIVPVEANKLLHATAKEPKKIIWLKAGHLLPHDQTTPIIYDWFKKYLF
jgi:fermentation-respiration switch protein FrsA (DUF1100 family)